MKKKKVLIPIIILLIFVILFSLVSPKFFWNVLTGNVSFPEKYVDSEITLASGKKYTVLQTLHVEVKISSPDDLAVFKVRFKFDDLSIEANKKLSMIPAPFLMGIPGFIEKNWVFNNETGDFQGIYQWESLEFAKKYPDSFIFKLMTKRAVPGSLSYEIKPNTEISHYLEKLNSRREQHTK
jgi:hypothetical protein